MTSRDPASGRFISDVTEKSAQHDDVANPELALQQHRHTLDTLSVALGLKPSHYEPGVNCPVSFKRVE